MFKGTGAVLLLTFAAFLSCGKNATEPPAAPAITTQPQSQVIIAGNPVTFTVAATGNPEPSYQWLKNDTILPGKTGAVYTIPAAALADSGTYSVAVSNSQGTVSSDLATLTVCTLPQITQQPVSYIVTQSVDSSFAFTVTATGIPEPTYQWRKEGFDIPGATSATYAKTAATLDDAGTYRVVVSNIAGYVYSDSVTLTVNP
jgi:D-alanyl-D-alanine carboxypeptidase